MTKAFFSMTLILIASVSASAVGAVSGGGGRGIVCRDKMSGKILSAELLDLFEAKNIFNLTLRSEKVDFNEEAKWLEAKLKKENHQFHFNQQRLNQDFLNKIQFVGDDVELTPVDDSFESLVPKNCAVEQIANYHQSGRILLKKDIWDAFSPMNQLALAVHELAYKSARDWGRPLGSYYVRRFVGFLFSTADLPTYKRNPRYEVNYFCTNTDANLGTNVIYELEVGGNKCKDRSDLYCEGGVSFRTVNGQIVYDSTTLEFSVGQDFLRFLDPTHSLIEFSVSAPLNSKIFEGTQFIFTIVEKDGNRIPQVAVNQAGSKNFVDLKCNRH